MTAKTIPQDILQRAANIKLAVFDVDGVFTDGRITLDEHGAETKSFHVHDGYGIRLLLQYGIEVAILSARSTGAVEHRMRALGIKHILQGKQSKGVALDQLVDDLGYEKAQLAYAGDDIIDVQAMTRVGLAIAVANAHPWTKKHAHWVGSTPGGHGAVREICELLLQAHGLLDEVFDYNLKC